LGRGFRAWAGGPGFWGMGRGARVQGPGAGGQGSGARGSGTGGAEALHETGEHSPDLGQQTCQLLCGRIIEIGEIMREGEQGVQFAYRALGDSQESDVVRARVAAVALGDVGGNGDRRAAQLRREPEQLTPGKRTGLSIHLQDKRVRLLPYCELAIALHLSSSVTLTPGPYPSSAITSISTPIPSGRFAASMVVRAGGFSGKNVA